MFGFGFFEILIILGMALIFIKPEDLPKVIYKLGKIYGKLTRIYEQFKNQINKIQDDFEESLNTDQTKKLVKNVPYKKKKKKSPKKIQKNSKKNEQK